MKSIGLTANNFKAAVVLFLVALPLNLGVAVAAGVPAACGIVSGVVGALLTGGLSGASLLVSGPDAGIGVLVLEMIQQFGIDKLGPIVLLSGLIQILIGFTRGARWFRIFSPSVVNGMLAGMGLIIILTQFLIMLDSTPKTTGFANLAAIPEVLAKATTATDGLSHHPAACIGLLSISVALLWIKFSRGPLKHVPAPLVAIVVASTVTTFLDLPIQLIKVPHELSQAISVCSPALLLQALSNGEIWAAAATLAFVTSTQSLLTAAAIDSASKGHKTNYDRELVAQGIGNVACGILGALPVAGVLLRSMANVQAAADSKSANIVHGTLILLAVLLIPAALNHMPVSALAAMLVYIGCRMVVNIYRAVKSYERSELIIVICTVIAIMATNLFTGILTGFALAAAKVLYSLSYLGIKLETTNMSGRSILRLWGAATFLHMPRLATVLESVPPTSELHVRLDELNHIDHACIELLMDWAERHREDGGNLCFDLGSIDHNSKLCNLRRFSNARRLESDAS